MATAFQFSDPGVYGGSTIPGASNQYGPMPTMPQSYTQFNQLAGAQPQGTPASSYIPGVSVPTYGAPGSGEGSYQSNLPSNYNVPMNYAKGPGNIGFEDPTSPALQGAFSQYLQGQVGQGLPAFNLPTTLATGGTTAPGAVNAPLNPVLQQLMDYFTSGKTGGNSSLTALDQLSKGTSAIPQWQQDIAAQQQQIQQQQANLKEQFASTGGLGGSEYGNAMSNFQQGTTAQQNALLAQIQQQNQQTQLGAATTLQGLQQQLGQALQGLDQQDIQNMFSEFMQTLPQNNPLLQYIYGQANSYAPIFNRQTGASTLQNVASGMGIASGLAGGLDATGLGQGGGILGSIISAIANI